MKDRQDDKGVARWQKGPDIYEEGHFPRREQWHDKPGGKVIDGRYPAKKKFKQRLHDIEGMKEIKRLKDPQRRRCWWMDKSLAKREF
jgi:hypothetical protein